MTTKGEIQMIKGFDVATKGKDPKRLIIGVDGRERTGKTTFGLSAPGPIAFFPLDPGREGVLEKYLDEKKVYLPKNGKGEIETYNYRDATNQAEWAAIWERLKASWLVAIESKEVRTLVVDTATEMWELVRLARFGKLLQVMPHHYGPVNAEFRNIIKKVYDTDKNLILIHKLKDEYVNDKTTGRMKRSGFGDTGYLVQINLTLGWNQEDGFTMVIKDCRQNMEIAGMELIGEMSNFQMLASMVYPETDESEWI
jgi:hypothetical protein